MTAETLDFVSTHANENASVPPAELTATMVAFLDTYGTAAFMGTAFQAVLGQGDGDAQFRNLLHAAGAGEADFWREVLDQLASANHERQHEIAVGGVRLPNKFLLPVLEQLLPGKGFVTVKNVAQYESLTNTRVPENQREDLQKVIEKFPVRLSRHVIRQSRLSPHVAYQFMPFVDELDEKGHQNTWIGQFHQGLLEQMYQNRPIFVLHMSCPVYCRFCFRKHKDCRNLPTPTVDDVSNALQYIKNAKDIKEIVLTGGEPLMNRDTLTHAVEGLGEMPHIQTIRIASRCISYYPQMFFNDDEFWLRYLLTRNAELQKKGKRIEIATHFIHPDEVSHYSLEIISRLVNGGISVYTQTPFLKNCNDSGMELTELYRQLRGAGSEMHYIYIPCSPIQGNSVYWTEIADGHKAAAYLRANLSDRAMPIICTATPIGKIDWNTSGWAVSPHEENPDDIWIRTPYSEDYFKQFAPNFSLMSTRANKNGTLDAPFMARVGDASLFRGHLEDAVEKAPQLDRDKLAAVQQALQADQRVRQRVVPGGPESLYRIHATRVELDIEDPADISQQLAYIAADSRITDVVLSARDGVLGRLDTVERIAAGLRDIGHVNALRLRSVGFTYSPELFTPELVERIAACNAISAQAPLRLELEAQFLHSSEFTDMHTEIIRRFLRRGVTVYNNIILLSGVNDDTAEMKRICYKCRQIGIELYHLYVAGLPIQDEWNADAPVEATDVIHIATHLRRHESGRELPLYVVRTAVGDADFNLTAIPCRAEEDRTFFRLRPYSVAHFRGFCPDFALPQEAHEEDGAIVAPVRGIVVRRNKEFFLR